MRRMVFGIIATLAFAPALWGDDPPKDKKDDKAASKEEKTPRQQYQALTAEVQKAQQEAIKVYREAKDEEERGKALEAYFGVSKKFTDRFLALAREYPKDKAAFDALVFVVNAGGKDGDAAVELLLKDHADQLNANLCKQMERSGSAAAGKLLKGILDKSTDKAVQAQACLTLAQNLKRRAEDAHTKGEAAKLSDEAETYYTRVTEKFSDNKAAAGQAKTALDELKRLGIGKNAPEIEGEDVDGKKFKLSDYRGKVVLLDFWGNW